MTSMRIGMPYWYLNWIKRHLHRLTLDNKLFWNILLHTQCQVYFNVWKLNLKLVEFNVKCIGCQRDKINYSECFHHFHQRSFRFEKYIILIITFYNISQFTCRTPLCRYTKIYLWDWTIRLFEWIKLHYNPTKSLKFKCCLH